MRTRLLLAAAMILTGSPGCALFRAADVPAAAPAVEQTRVPPPVGTLADLEAVPYFQATDDDAQSLLDLALSQALAAAIGERMRFAPGEQAADAATLDPFLVAWLHVDEAANLARIATTPLPEPRTVSAERQQIARAERRVPPGELHLRVLNTREQYTVRLFDNDGRMRIEAVRELTRALRDQRADAARSPDPRLLTMLYLIGQHYDAELEVVSGYRVRNLNASEGSRHGAAAACDIRIEGVGIREIARFAESRFADVGVGYYPNSDFVHVDARTASYYWVDYSGRNQRSRTRSRSVSVRADREADVTLRSIHITEEELYQLPPSHASYGYE